MKFIGALVVLSVYLRMGFSIRCYDCLSSNNSMCLDPAIYPKDVLYQFLRPVECTNGLRTPDNNQQFFCRKVVQTILQKGRDPELRVSRGCGWVRYHKDCYKADNEDHLETVCQCFSDECNAAELPITSTAVSFALLYSIMSSLINVF